MRDHQLTATDLPGRFPIVALVFWVLFAFLVPSFVQALNLVDVLAFPLGYFMAAQGILIAFVIIGRVVGALARSPRCPAHTASLTCRWMARSRTRTRPRAGLMLAVVSVAVLLGGIVLAVGSAPWRLAIRHRRRLLGARHRRRGRHRAVGRHASRAASFQPLFGGLAIATDTVSAAFFLALAGGIFAWGHDGLAVADRARRRLPAAATGRRATLGGERRALAAAVFRCPLSRPGRQASCALW